MQIYKYTINIFLVLIGLVFQVQAASDVNGNEASVVLLATPQWVNVVAGQSLIVLKTKFQADISEEMLKELDEGGKFLASNAYSQWKKKQT